MRQYNRLPRKLSAKEVQQARASAQFGLTLKQIAAILGYPKISLERLIKRTKGAQEEIDAGRAMAIAKVAKNAFEMAFKGDKTMIIFLLKTKGGFRETDVNVWRGDSDHPIDIRHSKQDIIDDKDKRKAEIKRLLEKRDADEEGRATVITPALD